MAERFKIIVFRLRRLYIKKFRLRRLGILVVRNLQCFINGQRMPPSVLRAYIGAKFCRFVKQYDTIWFCMILSE